MRKTKVASAALVITVIGFLLSSPSYAQSQQEAKPLQFEAAAIRPGNPKLNSSSSRGGLPGGQFQLVNAPLEQWVEMGLSVSHYALKAPSWLDTARFDLDARMPAGKPSSREAMAEMMRALLIERFGLKWHQEQQNLSGYELVPDKKVLAQPASLLERMRGVHGSSSGPTLIGGTNMSMSELAEALGKTLGRPVVDATHLSGGFDIKLMWRPDNDAAAAEQKKYGIDVDNLPSSLTAALQEQLGLRLQVAKVPTRVMFVDYIEKQPTEN